MKLTLARLAMKLMAPARPEEKQFKSVCMIISFIISYLGTTLAVSSYNPEVRYCHR
jgi:hypothetical protein